MAIIQFIERNGRREYAIVPMPLFTRMAALLEDLDDEALYDKAKAAADGFRVPSAVVSTILADTHTIKSLARVCRLHARCAGRQGGNQQSLSLPN